MAINPALKQLMAQKTNKYKTSGTNTKKLKEGRNVVRVIAPKPSEAPWVKEEIMGIFRDLGVHWIKPNTNNDTKPIAVVGSSEICYDRPSQIAAAVDAAMANAYDEEQKKLYESWKARTTVLVNMIDRSDNSVGPYDLPKGVWGKIMDLWNLYAEQDFDIFDANTGLDLAITRTGTGLNTKYDVTAMPIVPGRPFAPVTPDQIAAATDLDEYISSNFFRGDEPKALACISQISGVAIPQIGGPVTRTAALTSPAATVAGATVAPTVDPAALAAAQAAQAAAEQQRVAEEERQRQAQQAALMAQLAAVQAAAPAAAATAAAPAVQPEVVIPPATITATTQISDLSVDQQNDLLAQLAAIQ